jgi:hypothetical protein
VVLLIGSIDFVDSIFVGGDSMPKILEDRKNAIMRGNPKMREELAYAIATKQLQKSGKLKKKKKRGG